MIKIDNNFLANFSQTYLGDVVDNKNVSTTGSGSGFNITVDSDDDETEFAVGARVTSATGDGKMNVDSAYAQFSVKTTALTDQVANDKQTIKDNKKNVKTAKQDVKKAKNTLSKTEKNLESVNAYNERIKNKIDSYQAKYNDCPDKTSKNAIKYQNKITTLKSQLKDTSIYKKYISVARSNLAEKEEALETANNGLATSKDNLKETQSELKETKSTYKQVSKDYKTNQKGGNVTYSDDYLINLLKRHEYKEDSE